jgi:predicted dehydrogenase
MTDVAVGIVGGGLMGRELAAAIGRWMALVDHPVRPQLVAVCDPAPAALEWFERIETGSQSAFPTVTGPIFEFGFSDALLQMRAAFLAERAGALGDRLGCVTPEEALRAHELWDASLRSAASGASERIGWTD